MDEFLTTDGTDDHGYGGKRSSWLRVDGGG